MMILSQNKVRLMGILNVTPDSLFGGILSEAQDGDYESRIEKVARRMVIDGAAIIDVGGESTGPGSLDVSTDEEWGRVEPVLKVLQKLREEGLNFLISVDTYKSDVFEKSLQYGVDMLNDVTALRGDSRMVEIVAKSRVEVCLMYSVSTLHAEGNDIRTNVELVQYDDVIKTIGDFWEERISFAKAHGIKHDKIILDPGMGAFVSGDAKYSFEILDRLGELKDMFADFTILVGASRKGFTGLIFDENGNVIKKLPVGERLAGSLAAAKIAIKNGADIIRVHDIAETFAIL